MTRTNLARLLAVFAVAAFGPADAPGQKAAVAPAVVVQNAWPDEQFEQWAFGQTGNAVGARKRFDALLTLQVDELDRTCHLSAPQKEKLRMMGRGDVKRLFDTYEVAKREFNKLGNDVQKLQEVMPLVRPLQAAGQAGPFQAGSLFAKSLRHSLTDEQYERYQAADRERQALRHRAQIDMAVQMFEEVTPLRDAQRRALAELIGKETKPARTSSQYEFYLLMSQIGQLPDDKLKPLFGDAQWKVVSRVLDQYRQIAPQLRAQGVLADDDEDDPAPAKKK